jgi:hypothetical protein
VRVRKKKKPRKYFLSASRFHHLGGFSRLSERHKTRRCSKYREGAYWASNWALRLFNLILEGGYYFTGSQRRIGSGRMGQLCPFLPVSTSIKATGEW